MTDPSLSHLTPANEVQEEQPMRGGGGRAQVAGRRGLLSGLRSRWREMRLHKRHSGGQRTHVNQSSEATVCVTADTICMENVEGGEVDGRAGVLGMVRRSRRSAARRRAVGNSGSEKLSGTFAGVRGTGRKVVPVVRVAGAKGL